MTTNIPEALETTPITTKVTSNGTGHGQKTVIHRRRRRGLLGKARRTHVAVIKPIRTKTQGVLSVLVVRAIASDAQTTLSEETLFQRTFGDTSRTLSSVYNDCSFGKLKIIPASGAGIINGIVTVSITTTSVVGQSALAVTSDIKAATIKTVGDLAQWDHVMYCIPPGTSLFGPWLAYGEMSSSSIVFNDEWCGVVSVVAHEIGHNMGLEHSDEDNKSYDDQSGIMGISYNETGGPAM